MKRLLILEMQDGMMCKNDRIVVKEMIDAAIENKPDDIDMVFKWQLYTKIKTYVEIIPLKHDIFEYAYDYAKSKGFETTASVFDEENLEYLRNFETPFIKIACKTDLYEFRKNTWNLIRPNNKYIISVENLKDYAFIMSEINPVAALCCIPKYPATKEDYDIFGEANHIGISDHTIALDLYNEWKPKIFEKHFYIDGLDSWDKDWAIKPEEMKYL